MGLRKFSVIFLIMPSLIPVFLCLKWDAKIYSSSSNIQWVKTGEERLWSCKALVDSIWLIQRLLGHMKFSKFPMFECGENKLIVSISDTWSWKCFLMQVKLYKCSSTNYCYPHPETCRSEDFSHTHMSAWCHWILFQLFLTNASVKMEVGNLAWTVSTSTGLCSK